MSSRYQEWLKHIFDHEIRGHLLPKWYWDDDAPSFEAADNEMVELISQTFQNAGKDLAKYTDAQVDQGIWYLVSMSCSDFFTFVKLVGSSIGKTTRSNPKYFPLVFGLLC
jgi:hypothetical protein